MNEWMNGIWVRALPVPIHLVLKTDPLWPMIYYYVKGALFLYQSSKWPLYLVSWYPQVPQRRNLEMCMSETKASKLHKMCTEVSSSITATVSLRVFLLFSAESGYNSVHNLANIHFWILLPHSFQSCYRQLQNLVAFQFRILLLFNFMNCNVLSLILKSLVSMFSISTRED
jgi:hypothetical protein